VGPALFALEVRLLVVGRPTQLPLVVEAMAELPVLAGQLVPIARHFLLRHQVVAVVAQ
jgi:hypothetical protein